MERFVLTGAQWAKMEPHCLGKPTDPGRSGGDNRLFVEAVLWIVRTPTSAPKMIGAAVSVISRARFRWCACSIRAPLALPPPACDARRPSRPLRNRIDNRRLNDRFELRDRRLDPLRIDEGVAAKDGDPSMEDLEPLR
jgi:hypothetical protein